MNQFTIRGARGTAPACGAEFLRYGGNTTCFSVRTDGGVIIFDAGTGIVNVANEVRAAGGISNMTILFTHLHMDHLMGFPGFEPFYDPKAHLTLMADPGRSSNWRDDLLTFIKRPFWPIGLLESDAVMTFVDIPVHEASMSIHGVTIAWMRVPHPQGCMAYRVGLSGGHVVIATDLEYEAGAVDPKFVDFCRGADFLVFDAQFKPEEYAAHKGWGHSTWAVGVEVARRAAVGHLVLTHHAPTRRDGEVDAIVDETRQHFAHTLAASENLALVEG